MLGLICERLRQSAILGYLAAGTLLGPNAIGFVSDGEHVQHLAELGVALLLFTIGLEFSWPRLKGLGIAALGGGAAQILVTMAVGLACAKALGLGFNTSLVIGAIVSLSSTACVLRLLIARAEIESVHGRYALGILLMQDIAVVPLFLLVSVLGGEGSMGEVAIGMLKAVALAGVLVVVLLVLLNKIAPLVLGMEALRQNRDLPILLAFVVGIGAAWGSHELGLSPALGAFVAGMILAESPFATQIRADVSSIKTLLVTLFFASIGMLGDPVWFVEHIGAVMALVAAIVVGKALIIWGVLKMFGVASRAALAAGICLAQVGEFSFVLAAAAAGGELITEDSFTLIVSATIVSLFVTPYLVMLAPRLSASIHRMIGLGAYSADHDEGVSESDIRKHVVIIGFGPAGRAIGQAAGKLSLRVDVVDMNPGIVRTARGLGLHGHVADASHADVLEHLGINHAHIAIVTIPDPIAAITVIKQIRVCAPNTHIIARGRYHRHVQELFNAGAQEVLDEEELVGTRLAARLRRQLRVIDTP
ncbi:MAG: cation:proton antiporter [Phycisphaerales bacterium JB052]